MRKSKFLTLGNLGFAVTLLTTLLWVGFSSCDSKPPENSKWAQSEKGKVHFQKYCTSCHGEDGKGLVIDSLSTQPADLTRIVSSTKNGVFPILNVANMIDGRRRVKSHGPRDMPIWGEKFSEEEFLDEDQIKGKLAEIIAYLMSIQE